MTSSLRHLLTVSVLGLLVLLTACGKDDAAAGGTKTFEERFAIKVGDRTVRAQVALLQDETVRGLMFRKELGADEGMVFVYDRPQRMSFWMRNTTVPLDIGFFDAEGVLREVYPMYPRDERQVVSRGRVQIALEMNQGWYRSAGVKPGDRIDLEALAAAIRARGLRPDRFGLR